ncbi:VaFE repeat-containing surface-anchored protein [Micrococcales bacterium 31B]|nr:VaFE repeat-containing surface-anchored protein [Micrococcales bacterium 31B]
MTRSRRTAGLLAIGATLALAGTGTAVTVASQQADAATADTTPTATSTAPSFTITATSLAGSNGAETAPAKGYIVETTSYQAANVGQQVFIRSTVVDQATGEQLGNSVVTAIETSATSVGHFIARIPVTPDMEGKTVVVTSAFFLPSDVTGTRTDPGTVKPGAVPVTTYKDLTDARRAIDVDALNSTVAPAPTGDPIVVSNTTTGATVSTIATDKADGDKVVASGGVIQDVVHYTGLHVGTIYVLQTQLFDKTSGQLVNWTAAKIFAPSSPNGSETVTIPVPAGSEGHTFVVYQTIWAGADALVGKHLNTVKVRPGATPVV